MPAVVAAAFSPDRTIQGERIAFKARDSKRIEGTLWRPVGATGKRGARRVPTVIYPHGGPTWQAYRAWVPFKQLLAREFAANLPPLHTVEPLMRALPGVAGAEQGAACWDFLSAIGICRSSPRLN